MLSTAAFRTTPQRLAFASRALHASPAAYKTVVETVKDTAQKVNLKVGQTLAGGIDKGEKVTKSAQETVGLKTEEAKEATQEASQHAQHKAGQAAAGAREAKEDVKKHMDS